MDQKTNEFSELNQSFKLSCFQLLHHQQNVLHGSQPFPRSVGAQGLSTLMLHFKGTGGVRRDGHGWRGEINVYLAGQQSQLGSPIHLEACGKDEFWTWLARSQLCRLRWVNQVHLAQWLLNLSLWNRIRVYHLRIVATWFQTLSIPIFKPLQCTIEAPPMKR